MEVKSKPTSKSNITKYLSRLTCSNGICTIVLIYHFFGCTCYLFISFLHIQLLKFKPTLQHLIQIGYFVFGLVKSTASKALDIHWNFQFNPQHCFLFMNSTCYRVIMYNYIVKFTINLSSLLLLDNKVVTQKFPLIMHLFCRK